MALLPSGPYVSIASGIGGLDEGVAAATCGGAFPVLYVERELTAAAVLAARMEDGSLPPAPVWSDLRLLDARLLRDRVAGVVAGFPCQPYSVAGKQLGASDERDLWPECLRVVVEAGPDWCFFENVGGSLRDYVGRFEPDLRGAGYRAAAGLFTAAEVGAPHGRERLFFLAVADGARGGLGADGAAPGRGRHADERREELADAEDQRHERSRPARDRRSGSENGIGDVGDSDRGERDGRERESGRRSQRRTPTAGTGRSGDTWPPGPDDDWTGVPERLWPATAQPRVRDVADGLSGGLALSRADQLRLLGNAVVPAQAAAAMSSLMRTIGAEGTRPNAEP